MSVLQKRDDENLKKYQRFEVILMIRQDFYHFLDPLPHHGTAILEIGSSSQRQSLKPAKTYHSFGAIQKKEKNWSDCRPEIESAKGQRPEDRFFPWCRSTILGVE